MEQLITFFLSYLLAPLLLIVLLLVMGSIKSLKKQLSIKYALLYILVAGLLLGTPGFLSVLQDEYVWGGIFISVGVYIIWGLLALLTMKGSVGTALGISDKPLGQAGVLLASTILGAWIHYLLFTRFGGLPYGHIAMMQSLWFLLPFLVAFSLSRLHLVPPPIYELWKLSSSHYDRYYWEAQDHFKAKLIKVKIKRRTGDKSYMLLSARIPEGISLGDWFDWFMQDQAKRSPKAPIEGTGNNKDNGWLFYSPKWFIYPLFIRILDPRGTAEENRIRKGQIIYIKRVFYVNNIQHEEE